MIDENKREQKSVEKERIRKRMRAKIDPDNYEYIPAKKQADYYDNDTPQRVGIYVRVSTDDIRQTTSYELQKRYYEDFVTQHPNWTLVSIYTDEGISGTSLAHRDAFNQMIADAKAGKIDLIITKSVSRFARNVIITIGMVRNLAELRPPVGVFFESECIFSLNDDSQMALSFVATMAEEESHTRSRSMESSLRMRLDHGVPLTPKLLGYTHDADGNLIINEAEAPTVRLAFYMYLYGYSTRQIAKALNALGRRSYLGNVKWSAGGVLQILKNERHCGDVLTRKTYTENYRTHRTLKNRGEKPQSRYYGHHPAIITRDDFIAVQRMISNSKYGNRSFLPELRVVDDGFFKGFVIINPRWSGFKASDYYKAARSIADKMKGTKEETDPLVVEIEAEPGQFDLRGFEVARTELFDAYHKPSVTMACRELKFSTECVRRFGTKNKVELLLNPITRKLAIRAVEETNRNGVVISKIKNGKPEPKTVPAAAFGDTVFALLGWNRDYKYRMIGRLLEKDHEIAYVFDAENAEAYFKKYLISQTEDPDDVDPALQPLTATRKHIRAIPEEWMDSFGKEFYIHERPMSVIESQSEDEWNLRLQGQLFETGKRLNVTSFEELRSYIRRELNGINIEEAENERNVHLPDGAGSDAAGE